MKILIIFLLLMSSLYVGAQTVVWQMKPTDYNSIERINDNLYKVVRNGKIGLINADGSIVADVVNDEISDFYEHKALITCNDGHGERITGCLTDNWTYCGYTTKYYTLNGQKFFSDGLLSVTDESGNLGYIDEKGNQIVGFDGKYSRIKPFTEGYAAVMKNKKYVLINKEGNEMRFMYRKGVGATIAGCTNVYNGKAYVYDEYGGNDRSYFIYDAVRKSDLEKTTRMKNTAMDYLYCYQSVSGRTKDVPFEKMKPNTGIKGISSSLIDGRYGYLSSSSVIVPCQFLSASQFEDNFAIVNLNGQMGILKYVDSESFEISVPSDKHDFYAGNSVLCSFNLSVPSIWQSRSIDVTLKDNNGSAIITSNTSGTYTFSVKPSVSGQLEFSVIIHGEGLCLYEKTITYVFNKRERCATCGKDKSQCEYHGNHPTPKQMADNPCPACGRNNCEKHCYDCKKTIKECEYHGVH